jgi:hypothetical protein
MSVLEFLDTWVAGGLSLGVSDSALPKLRSHRVGGSDVALH